MSKMGRIAQEIEDASVDSDEYHEMCQELSLFWRSGDDSKLSDKSRAIWLEWKRVHEMGNINSDLVNEWSPE